MVLARAKSAALCLRSSGGRSKPPRISSFAPRCTGFREWRRFSSARMSAKRQARRSRVAWARSAITFVREPPETTSALIVTPRRRSFHFSRRPICAASSCTALIPFSGASPACEARPWTMSCASPTPLREVFSRPRGPSDGSSTNTASLRWASSSINLRDDSLPISSSEVHKNTRRF